MKLDFIDESLVKDSEREKTVSIFTDFIDKTLDKYRNHSKFYSRKDARTNEQSIMFLSEPTVVVRKAKLQILDKKITSYDISLSDNKNLKGVQSFDSVTYLLDTDNNRVTKRSNLLRIKGSESSDKTSEKEVSLSEVKSLIKFVSENEILEIEPNYDYFEHPLAKKIPTEVRNEEVKAYIPKDEQVMSPELNKKMNDYIGSILGSMNEKEIVYIIERIKNERKLDDEKIAMLKSIIDSIKVTRTYNFTNNDLIRLNKLRTTSTLKDDKWRPTGTMYWRDEYPNFSEKSDSPSTLIGSLYVSRFLLKELIAGLI